MPLLRRQRLERLVDQIARDLSAALDDARKNGAQRGGGLRRSGEGGHRRQRREMIGQSRIDKAVQPGNDGGDDMRVKRRDGGGEVHLRHQPRLAAHQCRNTLVLPANRGRAVDFEQQRQRRIVSGRQRHRSPDQFAGQVLFCSRKQQSAVTGAGDRVDPEAETVECADRLAVHRHCAIVSNRHGQSDRAGRKAAQQHSRTAVDEARGQRQMHGIRQAGFDCLGGLHHRVGFGEPVAPMGHVAIAADRRDTIGNLFDRPGAIVTFAHLSGKPVCIDMPVPAAQIAPDPGDEPGVRFDPGLAEIRQGAGGPEAFDPGTVIDEVGCFQIGLQPSQHSKVAGFGGRPQHRIGRRRFEPGNQLCDRVGCR